MYFAGYPQFNQSMPQMSMPVNATNQQGSSVQGANTGMFGMGLGGFGGGFSPSGFSMPQIDYSGGMGGPKYLPGDRSGGGGFGGGFGGMGGYGGFGMPQIGFGGFGMPQMGYGGFGGGFGMPQMGYGGYGGFGGFGMPQMGYGLGSFGPQMGFGGYGDYGGFQPPQQAPSGSIQDNMNNPAYRQQMAFVNGNSEEAIRNRIQGQLNDDFTRNKNAGMSLMDNAKAQDELSNRLYSQYGIQRPGYTYGVTPPRTQPVANPPTGGYGRGQIDTNDMVFVNDTPTGDAYIPDETGQYDPNRGNYGQTLAPTYSEPSAPGTEPLSVANPERNQEIIGTPIPANSAPINQPRRMRNSMNMGIGSFFGGIGPGNFRNFYTP